jgi:hypothetical protein
MIFPRSKPYVIIISIRKLPGFENRLITAESLQHPAFWEFEGVWLGEYLQTLGAINDKSVQWHSLKTQKARMFEPPLFEHPEICNSVCTPPIILTMSNIIMSIKYYARQVSGFDRSCQAFCLADNFEYRPV